ncbi:hypothetical protein [Tahibacter amnicola]|uniref:Uncharacterized protein n=1 Tax=Tahibacter amnicola TaxID=2976241 RepID=A0ABY6BMT6_9GAMM|nr:hypothetical protein [Tahibacter amnicola]UXI69132.1 hypothetical protein N4264_05635 [Tahibacter amnicola]
MDGFLLTVLRKAFEQFGEYFASWCALSTGPVDKHGDNAVHEPRIARPGAVLARFGEILINHGGRRALQSSNVVNNAGAR